MLLKIKKTRWRNLMSLVIVPIDKRRLDLNLFTVKGLTDFFLLSLKK